MNCNVGQGERGSWMKPCRKSYVRQLLFSRNGWEMVTSGQRRYVSITGTTLVSKNTAVKLDPQFRVNDDPEISQLDTEYDPELGQSDPAIYMSSLLKDDQIPGHFWPETEYDPNVPGSRWPWCFYSTCRDLRGAYRLVAWNPRALVSCCACITHKGNAGLDQGFGRKHTHKKGA